MTTIVKLGNRLNSEYLPAANEIVDNSLQRLIRIGIIYQYTKRSLRCAEEYPSRLGAYRTEIQSTDTE